MMTIELRDDVGRYLGTETIGYVRPAGPWDTNVNLTEDRPLAHVCAWCPDNRERTAAARADGFNVSHTMCAACAQRMKDELDKETR
jgi:hypothetical protein